MVWLFGRPLAQLTRGRPLFYTCHEVWTSLTLRSSCCIAQRRAAAAALLSALRFSRGQLEWTSLSESLSSGLVFRGRRF